MMALSPPRRFGVRDAFKPAMLRITLHQDGSKCRLELAGKLCGPEVGETERIWRSAPYSREEIEVDMREVTGVDDAGRELLATMHHAGVRLIAKGVWMTAVVEEIVGRQSFGGAKRQRRIKNLTQGEGSQIRRESK
jgi:hypothetical protein